MRKERLAGDLQFSSQDAPGFGFGDEQTLALRSPECEICRRNAGARLYAQHGFGKSRQPPDRPKAGVRHEQAPAFVQGHPVWSTQSSVQLRKYAYFRYDAAFLKRNSPYLLRARDGDQEMRHLWVDDNAVRTGDGVDKTAQYTAGRVSIHTSRGVLQSGLPLIGEVKVAGLREY